MTWLRQVPGVTTTAPTSITIDGHPGRSLDIRIDPAGKRCKGETTPSFSYLGPDIGLLGGERHRLILLDLGDGDVLAIVIRTTDPAAFDAFVVEAMPIVESLRFE